MRRPIFILASLTFAALLATSAVAQEKDAFEDEFRAFREKLEAAKSKKEEESRARAGTTGLRAVPMPKQNLPFAKQPRSPEDLQAIMEAEAEEQKKRIEEMTFDAALRNLMPLQPSQIRRTLEEFVISREAAETPIRVPEPRQVLETISLDIGDMPKMIKMASGYVTTVAILDSSGMPWPIQDISWAGKFAVTTTESGGHMFRIVPQSTHGVGNISIRLVDLITPITLRLATGLEEVHYRFDARIPKMGPLAKVPIMEYGGLNAVAGTDGDMTGVLDGAPPPSAVRLHVNGVDGRTTAWNIHDKLYLRTPLTLLSPAWESSVTSSDGTNVYLMDETPVILLSDNGHMVRAQIAGNEVMP